MVRDQLIPVDLETSYLHLVTNSVTGSGDKTAILHYSEEELEVGGIFIWFTFPIRYSLPHYQDDWTTFPFSGPSEQDKHWLIEKRGYRTVFLCNDHLVLDITFSYSSYRADRWGREVTKVSI